MPYSKRIVDAFALLSFSLTAQVRATEQSSGTKALLIGINVVSDQVVWVSGTGGTWLRTIDGRNEWMIGKDGRITNLFGFRQ